MKISDFIYKLDTHNPSICRARIFINKKRETFIVLTDLGSKNIGTSITNAIEYFHKGLINQGYISHQANVIEHYEESNFGTESFDRVIFDEHKNPDWKKIPINEAYQLLEADKNEFSTETLHIKRLFDQIQKIRHSVDPFIDSPYPEDHETANRRESIQNSMISKNVIQNLIENNANETKIHNLIKSDLSLIIENFVRIDDEYICISEFPIDDGFVDFAIFTGRSRMDVILIEIKGADYKTINKNNYENFSSKTNEAAQQIRRRIGFINRNYREFKKYTHDVRNQIENGNCQLKHLIGPFSPLQVDPNKDIKIKGVVIGGRCRDDLNDSKLRHEFEWNQKPEIMIESWDSWIKKLKRK